MTTELNQEQKKNIYKQLVRYKSSKNYTDLITDGKSAAEWYLQAIKEEFANRSEIKLEYSDVTKLWAYIKFVQDLISKIDDSEAGKIIKETLQQQVNNAETHFYNKVEIGFDAPSYTKLDSLKELRNMNLTIERRIDEVINSYMPDAKDDESLHPYEEN